MKKIVSLCIVCMILCNVAFSPVYGNELSTSNANEKDFFDFSDSSEETINEDDSNDFLTSNIIDEDTSSYLRNDDSLELEPNKDEDTENSESSSEGENNNNHCISSDEIKKNEDRRKDSDSVSENTIYINSDSDNNEEKNVDSSEFEEKIVATIQSNRSLDLLTASNTINYDAGKALSAAKSHTEYDQSKYGSGQRKKCSEGWVCADFVAWAVQQGGIPASVTSGSGSAFRERLLSSGYCEEYKVPLKSNGSINRSDFNGIAEPGDIVFYYCPYEKDGKPFVHTVLFAGWNSSGQLTSYAHNYRVCGDVQCYPTCGYCGGGISEARILHFKGNGGGSINNKPNGNFEVADGGCKQISVRGWAFDPDEPSKQISIHVYIGGPSGDPNSEGTDIGRTNHYREDVNNAYGITGNHGFQATINTSKVGEQPIYVYAIDSEGGENPLLTWRGEEGKVPVRNITQNTLPTGCFDSVQGGLGEVTVNGWAFDPDRKSEPIKVVVTIGAPFDAPSGSFEWHLIEETNVYRSDVNNTYGLTGKHGFSAKFTTSKSGSVPIYIYPIDKDDETQYTTLTTKYASVTPYYPVSGVGIGKNNIILKNNGSTAQLNASIIPSNATHPGVQWCSSDTSVVTVNQSGKITAKGVGEAYVTVKTSEGGFTDRCFVRVVNGNVIYGDGNRDGSVTVTDLSIMNQAMVGKIELTEAEKVVFDLNGDDNVAAADLSLLNQFLTGKITRFPVEGLIDKIGIYNMPTKTEYYEGDTITSSGIKLILTYRDGSTKVYTPSGLPTYKADDVGARTITINYTEAGITRSTSYTVMVHKVYAERIDIIKAPNKTSYVEGDTFDPTGMVVQATYNNGTKKNVSNYRIALNRVLTVDDVSVPIGFSDFGFYMQTKQTVTVRRHCDVYGHSWGNYTSKGNTSHTKICSFCGKSVVESCEFQTVIFNPTCLNDGYTMHYCSKCDNQYEDNLVPRTGHSYTNRNFNWNKSGNGYECVATLTCSNCEDWEEGHIVVGNASVVESIIKTANCTEAGEKQYTATFKGYQSRKNVSIPKLGHAYEWIIDREPTVSQTGIKHEECIHCGDKKNLNTEIPKLDNGIKDISCSDITIEPQNIDPVEYTGERITPNIIVYDNGNVLNKDVDYSLSYEHNDKIGTGTVNISGIGNYSGNRIKSFEIVPQMIEDINITIDNQIYSGEALTPSVVLYDKNGRLMELDTDYAIVWGNNVNIGTAVAMIVGKNNYSGSKIVTFEIISGNQHSHSYGSVITEQPTCTTKGTRVYICSCGDTYSEEISALGHDYSGTVTKEPTVTEAGETTYLCLRCGDKYSEPIGKLDGKSIRSIQFEKSQYQIEKDESTYISCNIEPLDATNADLVWETNNPQIVSVNQEGQITGREYGETVITVKQRGNSSISASYKIIVADQNIENTLRSINFKGSKYNLQKGDIIYIGYILDPQDCSDFELQWTSKNTNIATVNQMGLVTAVNDGETIITVTGNNNPEITASCKIIVGDEISETSLKTIKFEKTSYSFDKNESGYLKYVINPTNADDVDLIWKSDNENIATVNQQGYVTAIDYGETIISVSQRNSPGIRANCIIKVIKGGGSDNSSEEPSSEDKDKDRKAEEEAAKAAREKELADQIAISENRPMAYSTETRSDLRISYNHGIPFWGKGKVTLKNFGEISISVNEMEYKVTKVKVNKKKHLIQVIGLEKADKSTVKAAKKATKGKRGLPFTVYPYNVKNTDAVSVTFNKKGIGKVSIQINDKQYSVKKKEFIYDAANNLITFSSDNLTGSYNLHHIK